MQNAATADTASVSAAVDAVVVDMVAASENTSAKADSFGSSTVAALLLLLYI